MRAAVVSNPELHAAAVDLATHGAAVALGYFARVHELEFEEKRQTGDAKNAAADLVSDADRDVERRIRERLARLRPEDGFLGEEGTRVDGEIVWVVDPIDGTLNFAYGRADWVVSVAATDRDGNTLAGAIVHPVLGVCYSAVAGQGAWKDGKRLELRPRDALEHCLVEIGRGKGETRRRFSLVVEAVTPVVRDVRRQGSAALALAMLAAGETDISCGPGLEPWDMAAGALIAREAGARVENLSDGGPDRFMTLGAHPRHFAEFRDLLLPVLGDLVPGT